MKKQIDPCGRYCAYLRKSRADRDNLLHGDADVLARHEHILMDLARRMNITVSRIFREVVSGDTITSRPEVQKLLSEVEAGVWDGVLVVEVERLARGDSIDQGIISRSFTYSHTLIITPAKIYDPEDEFDSEYFEFGLFMSRREYKTINRRLNRGREQSAMEGKYTGNKPPYGYERVKLTGEKGFTLTPAADQADVVRMIYDLYVHGDAGHDMGVSLIVRRLNALHIPAATGGEWSNSSVQDILANPVYIGMIRRKWRPAVKTVKDGVVTVSRPRASETARLYQGRHPAIIPEALFQAAQEKRRKNPPRPVPCKYIVQNPLSGLIVCAKCGRRMSRRPYGNGRPDSLICQYTSCGQISSPLWLVEQKLLEGLRSIINDEINTSVIFADSTEDLAIKEQMLENASGELQDLSRQKEKIYDLLENGVYTTEIFLERSALLTERIHALTETIETMQEQIREEKERRSNRELFIPRAEHLLAHYNELSAEEKNTALKELLEKVDYDKIEKNRRGNGSNASFTLHLYPRVFSHRHSAP